MKNILKLNTPALSKPLSVSGLDIRPYTSALSYIDETRVIKSASEEIPLYRLCKDYEVNDLKFALNLIITDENTGKGEDFMDKIAKNITQEQVKAINSPFVWLDSHYKVGK